MHKSPSALTSEQWQMVADKQREFRAIEKQDCFHSLALSDELFAEAKRNGISMRRDPMDGIEERCRFVRLVNGLPLNSNKTCSSKIH
ncbi:MAG: hypothetical protein OEM52_08605 [bacterium]|nr:hypothetical protein [bacterium]